MKLSDRDMRFAEEYMIDLNAYEAAKRAGYAPSTARNAASWINAENPGKPNLRRRIEELMAEQSKRTGCSADRVIRELGRIAFANPGDVIEFETGKVRQDASRDDMAAIASVTVKGGKAPEYEVRMCDKTQALKLLGMHFGAFEKSIRLDGPVPVIIDDSGEYGQDAESGKKIGYE